MTAQTAPTVCADDQPDTTRCPTWHANQYLLRRGLTPEPCACDKTEETERHA